MRKIVPALLLFVCASAFGQSVGTLSSIQTTYDAAGGDTLVDFGHPATSAGVVTTATVFWYTAKTPAACASAFKIKILRPTPSNGSTYSVVADRGPFDAPATGYITVPLSPAVTIQLGDLIAVTHLKTFATCGSVMYDAAGSADRVMTLAGEGSGTFNGTLSPRRALLARASATSKVFEGVLAAAGSVAGANGASFRTSLQLTNMGLVPISGTLVFHPAGTAALPSDPSLDYTVGSAATVSYPDLPAQLGASGLGSVDIISNASGAPTAVARIFNDLGTGGTSGFTEELISVDRALHVGDSVTIAHPADTANYRMNIGVRTFGDAVTLSVVNYLPGGSLNASSTRDYVANFFEQVPLSTFIGTGQVLPNGSVLITVTKGTAVVYASTTDNRTNDSSIRFALRPE